MALIIINPNSTASMTEAMVAVARTARPGIEVEGWTSREGPPAIEGPADGARAVPPLLELVRRAADGGADTIVIGCFDDTGLREAARLAPCPVLGIGQAAMHEAALRLRRFSVVTTLPVSVPVIEDNIRHYGFTRHLARVRASGVPVLGLKADRERNASVAREAARAATEDGIDCILLGCAGMARMAAELTRQTGIPVIDGVAAAVRLSTCLRQDR